MSRFVYNESVIIDLIVGYPVGINTDFIIIFPGESLLVRQLESNFSLLSSSSSLSLYTTDQNKYRLLITNIAQSKSSTFLSENLNQLSINSLLSSITELYISINFYKDEELGNLTSSVSNTLNHILSSDLHIKTITLFSTFKIFQTMSNMLNQLCKGKNEIYSLNHNTKYELYDKIMCKTCRELPFIPYVSSCCLNIYCEDCVKTSKFCFDCLRENPEFTKEKFLNSFFCDFMYKCPCEASVNFERIQDHVFSCNITIFNCKIENCHFKGSQAELVAHAIVFHSEYLLNNINTIGTIPIVSGEKECSNCSVFYNAKVCGNCGYNLNQFSELIDKLDI